MGATRAVEKELIWSARSLGATDRSFSGRSSCRRPAADSDRLQIALPICMIVVLVTEMVMGGEGLGSAMLRASRFADSPGVFSGILSIGIAGFLVIKSLEIVRRRLLSWHQEVAQDRATV